MNLIKAIRYFFFSHLLFVISCSAQKNIPVINVDAYFTIPTGGTIQVDESGREMSPRRDTVFYLYAEVKNKTIEWGRAWVNGASYSIVPMSYTTSKTNIGKKLGDGQPVNIAPKEGNSLQQLELSNDQKHNKSPQTLRQNEVLVQYKWKGKVYYCKASAIVQLTSPEYQ